MSALKLVDLSRWQPADVNMEALISDGFTVVNVQLNGSNGYVAGSWSWSCADRARASRMGLCAYHWLDNLTSGAEQARAAFQRMVSLGGPDRMAHMVDCEDTNNPATWIIWRDYVNAMQDLLGRHVIAYTGRWWWRPRWLQAQATGKPDWTGSALTPYLCAAPNAGYIKDHSYPGDASAHWFAGYGGWKELSAMQYAVNPVPPYTVNFSKSAIRDRGVWFKLTGEEYPMHVERDAGAPQGKTLVRLPSGVRVVTVEADPATPLPPQSPDAAMDADRGNLEKFAGAAKRDPWDD